VATFGQPVTVEYPDKGIKLEILASPLEAVIATAGLSSGVPSGWLNRSNPNWALNAVTVTVSNGEISIPASATHYQVFEAWPVTGLAPGDKVAIEFDYDAPAGSHPYVGANTAADMSGTWFGNELVPGQAKTKQRILFTVPQANMWILFGNNVPATPTSTTTVKFSNIRLLRPFDQAVEEPPPPTTALEILRVRHDGNLFDPNSFLRRPLRTDAPVLPNSAAIVADLVSQINAGVGHMDLNVYSYTPMLFVADETTPTVAIKSDGTGAAWGLPYYVNEQLAAVPAPPGFGPSKGSDAPCLVIRRTKQTDGTYTFSCWEMWGLRLATNGEWVCWTGSRADHLETHSGRYHLVNGTTSEGSYSAYPGVTAAGIPFYPLMISEADVLAGEIDHPIGLVVTNTKSTFVWPATRTDGGESTPIEEGVCLRFPTNMSFLGKSRLAQMVGRAIQKYGAYVIDRGDGVSIRCQNPSNLLKDPFYGDVQTSLTQCPSSTTWDCWAPARLAELDWSQLQAVDPRAGQNLVDAT
jgi:hypothetical protein